MDWLCCQNPGRRPAISRRANGARDVGAQANRIRRAGPALRCRASVEQDGPEVLMSKGSEKPKKQQKQKPQKTLKERRSEKRAAKKLGSGSSLTAGK